MFKDSLFVDCNAFTQLAECENVLGNYQNAEEYFAIADSLFTNFSQQGKYKYIHFLLLNKRGNNLIMLGERDLLWSVLKELPKLRQERMMKEAS